MTEDIIKNIPQTELEIYGVRDLNSDVIRLITRSDGASFVRVQKKRLNRRFLRYLLKTDLELMPACVWARLGHDGTVAELSGGNEILYRQPITPMHADVSEKSVARVLFFLNRQRG